MTLNAQLFSIHSLNPLCTAVKFKCSENVSFKDSCIDYIDNKLVIQLCKVNIDFAFRYDMM